MLLNVRNIPSEGLDVDFVIPAQSMSVGLQESDDLYEVFDTDVACDLHFEIDQMEIFLTGTSQNGYCADLWSLWRFLQAAFFGGFDDYVFTRKSVAWC